MFIQDTTIQLNHTEIYIIDKIMNIGQGFHLKPVATEIRCLHFTLPPATFCVSRIKNA
jgi:hypothetical protein